MNGMAELPRLVLSYLGEDVYHAPSEDDGARPRCLPRRIRGIPAMRVIAERHGQSPCPRCWPGSEKADTR